MLQSESDHIEIDYIEMYVPVAKPLVYWHEKALGFSVSAYKGQDTGFPGISSYVLRSNNIALMITSSYPYCSETRGGDVDVFVKLNSCGVKRIAFRVDSVQESFLTALANGAIPIRFPYIVSDEFGSYEEAAIKLFDQNEILFIDRSRYFGPFKPGYKTQNGKVDSGKQSFRSIDHIACELRINETDHWTDYMKKSLGNKIVQRIGRSVENLTGMIMNISQTVNNEAMFVLTESEKHFQEAKVQQNIDRYGPGIHHLAFSTNNIIDVIKELRSRDVDFVGHPKAYYDQLREKSDLQGIDIDLLEEQGILIDKEGDAYLLQKFIKPMGDRPYFFYEIVERINGYNGFALNNIIALRKAEETQISHTEPGRGRLMETVC